MYLIVSTLPMLILEASERQRAVQRYDAWQKLRAIAMKNASGTLPPSFHDVPHAQPPPPPDISDDDILNLTNELNAVSIDDHTLMDENSIDQVPKADIGLDVSPPSPNLKWTVADISQSHSVSLSPAPQPQGLHLRRRSELPGEWYLLPAGHRLTLLSGPFGHARPTSSSQLG